METIVIRVPEIKDQGGWALDTQFTATMGTPYLLAHGLGIPVADAKTDFTVESAGDYWLYVYTYNWVAPWKPEYAPGIFEIHIDGRRAGRVFGSEGKSWGWQSGGRLSLGSGSHSLAVKSILGSLFIIGSETNAFS